MTDENEGALKTTSRKSRKAVVAGTVATAIAVVGLLVAVAVLGMDTLRGVRGFVGAEGLWSKQQKDATHSLLVYARTTDPAQFTHFRDHLKIIDEVRQARLELDRASFDRAVVIQGFSDLGVEVRDVPSIIRVYRRFGTFPVVADAIDIWVEADKKIIELAALGDKVRAAVEAGAKDQLGRLLQQIDDNDSELRLLEDRFSKQMARAAHWAHGLIGISLTVFALAALGVITGLGIFGARQVTSAESFADDLEATNWLKTSRSELAEAMAGLVDDQELFTAVIKFLTPRLNAQVGALFLAREDGRLKLRASYAYSARKELSSEFAPGEGVVGQAVLERQPILLTRVPDDYVCIRSGLGDATPRNILVYPIADETAVQAVIEVASIDPMPQRALELLDLVNMDIAYAVEAVRARRVNQELLEQSRASEAQLQVVNEELEAQQEELRQSNDELEAQQRQLEEINTELEERGQELERERQQVQAQNAKLEETRDELERKASDLDRASRYKSEFLANMSHELRTPLNSIIVLSGLLAENREALLSDKQVGYARTIGESGNQLLELISEILDLSKIEAGRLELNLEPATLRELIAPIERQFRPVADDKGLEFRVTVADAAPAELYTDDQRLGQVIRNLLSNALKFTDTGAVVVDLRRPLPEELDRTSLTLEAEHMLAVAVRDSGIGISQEQQQQVFEAFEQADGSTDRKYEGTGLGLAISRRLARLLGGEILLDSVPGEGSCFTLLVPQESVGPAPAPVEVEADAGSTEIEASPGKARPSSQPETPRPELPPVPDDRDTIAPGDRVLLIIEDDPTFAATLVDLGRERSYRCLAASDGETGLALTEEYDITAILLDLTLPGIDGMTVMSRLKDDLRTRHIPVHVISGRQRLLDTLRAGAIGYLQKPINIGQLDRAFSRIDDLVSRPVRRLVVAEADEASSATIVDGLEGRDLEISVVRDGATVLEAIHKQRIDCVVVGDALTDMTALELLSGIRKDDRNPDTPVVMIAPSDQPQEELNLLHRYADRVIGGEHTQARLLDETALFLHRVERDLPEDKRRVLRSLHDKEAILHGRRILIVDDDMRNVFALSSVLEDAGMEVVVARHGGEALSRLEENSDIDLVLMDIMMPEMDGYEAMRRIRADDRFRELPILALTAKAMRDDRAKCIEAGANDYLAKPVDTGKLLSMMRVWLYR